MSRRETDEFIDTFSAVSKCLRAVIAKEYASFEVGGTQAQFVRHIGRNGQISQAELARATRTDRALTGRALETLVERGWVRRKRSKKDRREYVLELTASGRRFGQQVEKARSDLGARIVRELDGRDLVDFERIAKKLLAAFGDSATLSVS